MTPETSLATSRPVALITGASSGIGADFARELASRNHDVIITARRTDRLEALKAELEKAHRVRVDVVPANLGASDGVTALIAAVEALGRPVDVLVNNAGFGVHGPFWEHDAPRIDEMIALNMTSLTRLTHHFVRQMVPRGRGRVLQVSSVGAYQSSPYYAIYAATKSYVLNFSEAANFELRGTGVTITTLSPGLTATEFHDVANHQKTGLFAVTLMTAAAVARNGVEAMLRGRAVVVPGWINKLAAFSVRFFPRSWATAVAGLMMRK